jgi:hypothetical protein
VVGQFLCFWACGEADNHGRRTWGTKVDLLREVRSRERQMEKKGHGARYILEWHATQ